jgi:predicted RNA-binding Zn-ribbon protein involved in translation (DUF1610 family)
MGEASRMTKTAKREDEKIEVCPNCGKNLNSNDYLGKENLGWMRGASAGTFTCQKCGYDGSPILLDRMERREIRFENRPIRIPAIPGSKGNGTVSSRLVLAAILVFVLLMLYVSATTKNMVCWIFVWGVLFLLLYLAFAAKSKNKEKG